jgi:hypothetical protein
MQRTLLLALSCTLALSCSSKDDDSSDSDEVEQAVDSDGDGISDEDEEALGTDPNSDDSDNDGISDGDEAEAGTDPNSEDSDGDGYQDKWEMDEGTDPTDSDSVIYTGLWPYNPDKETMDYADWSGSAEDGALLPWFEAVDQFGDTVDIYDFANQGKPVLLDLSTSWCYYCGELSAMLDGEDSLFSDYSSHYDWVEGLPEMVENGDIYWITVLSQNSQYGEADEDTVADWYDDYPNPNIPVLAYSTGELEEWLYIYGYPTVILLDEDLTVEYYDFQDYTAALDEAMKYVD